MIRKMVRDDLEVVAGIENACFSEAWPFILLEEGLNNSLDAYFVVEEDGVICGYCNIRVIAGEGEIQRIAVHPQFQGMGCGKKLMEAMVAFAREQGVCAITLEVRSGNLAARNLYKRYGFCEEALRRTYYRNPVEDAVIMWGRSI